MKTLAIFLICGILQFFLPWWIIVVVSFGMSLVLAHHVKESFFNGFISISILWCIACLVQSIPNEQILAVRIAQMFHLSHAWILTLVTSVLGGCIAGISGLCGYYCRIFWVKTLKEEQA